MLPQRIIPLLQSHRDWICETLLIVLRNNRESNHLVNKLTSADWLLRKEKQFNTLLRGEGIFSSACLLLLCVFMCLPLWTVTQQLKTLFFFLIYCFQVEVFLFLQQWNSLSREVYFYIGRGWLGFICLWREFQSIQGNIKCKNWTSVSQPLLSCLKSPRLRERQVKSTCYLSYKMLGTCSNEQKEILHSNHVLQGLAWTPHSDHSAYQWQREKAKL